MTPFERKIVHDAVAAVDGVHSESSGAERRGASRFPRKRAGPATTEDRVT